MPELFQRNKIELFIFYNILLNRARSVCLRHLDPSHQSKHHCFQSVIATAVNRELKQPRRRRWVRRQVKNEFIFYERNSQLSRSVRFVNGSKIVLELNVQWRRVIPNGNTKYQPSSSTFRTGRRIWSFHVVVLQRMAKKCTKIYNARAQPLFCSLNLLLDDVLVAVVVVVCLSSLLFSHRNLPQG